MDSDKQSKAWGWLLLGGISLLYFCANMQKVIVPGSMFNELQQMFSMEAAQVTRLGAAFMYSYAFMQLVAGLLADRYCGARVILFGGVVFCAGSLLSACNGSATLLLFSRMLTGMGAASVFLSAVTEISRIAPHLLPLLIGILTIIGYSGSLVGMTPFIAGVEKWGVQLMLLWAGVLAVVCYALFGVIYAVTPLPATRREVKFNLRSYWEVLRVPHNLYLIGVLGIGFGTYYAIQTVIGKKFLEDYCGMSATNAGAIMSIMMMIATVNSFILANLSRMWGNRRCPFLRFSGWGCLASALVLTVALSCNYRQGWLTAAAMILLAFAGNISSMSTALFRETNEEHRFGTIMSVSNWAAYMVTAAFGGSLGKLMDLYPPMLIDGIKVYGRCSYLLVFAVLLALSVISSIVSCFLKESYGKNIASQIRAE